MQHPYFRSGVGGTSFESIAVHVNCPRAVATYAAQIVVDEQADRQRLRAPVPVLPSRNVRSQTKEIALLVQAQRI